MKVLLLFIIFAGIGGYVLFSNQSSTPFNQTQNTMTSPTPVISLTPNSTNLKVITVQLNEKAYTIYSSLISTSKKLVLIPNFTQKEFGQNIAETNNCTSAINGGFYTKANTPLGLFAFNGTAVSKEIQSNLVNGFFWENEKGIRFAEKTPPADITKLHFIFQSGPLIRVGNYKLKIVNDEMDRRSLIGKDEKNNFYMISITQNENSLSGPLLSDIARIFFQASIQKEIPFTQLLNLDGGSASFFYAKDGKSKFVLSELTSIGSLICVQ